MEKVFRVASKIADKIVIMDKDLKTIETTATIMAGHVEDLVSKLKELSIDITPELEELKQVFAEISGKKIEKKPSAAPKPQTIPPEVFAIAKGLKFAGYSEEALKKAEGEIIHRLDALIEQNIGKNALEIAYYSALLRLIQKRELEKIERIFGN